MFREIAQILTEVCSLLTYPWTGIRADQPFSTRSREGRSSGLWGAFWRPWPLEPHDSRPRSI